jgi:hypothetical protein
VLAGGEYGVKLPQVIALCRQSADSMFRKAGGFLGL